jgi:hypothetical protein
MLGVKWAGTFLLPSGSTLGRFSRSAQEEAAVIAKFWFCAVAYGSIALAQSPGTFTTTGAMAASRVQHTATLLLTGKVLITGGNPWSNSPPTSLASAELYDPSSGTFSATGSMTTPREGHTATLLADGRVLIAGGSPGISGAPDLASAELYDPATRTFTRTGDMTQGRVFHAATLLANGKVLIAGSLENGSVELYDPSTGTFSVATQLPLSEPQLTLLADGKVLAQGLGGDKPSAVLYDPATSTFAVTGQPPYSFPVINANLLTSGKVLDSTFDGCGWPEDFAELYDPSTGAFTSKKTTPRRGASATLLSDATVLIAGGGDTFFAPGWSVGDESGAEIYDPATDQFSATGKMTENRESHTATLLPDGTVLIAGGWFYGSGTAATAEIYHPKVSVPAPLLLSLSGDGRGAGAILHAATHQVVSPGNPAVAWEALEIYGTGLIDGVIPPQVAIGGRMAELLFFGKAPAYPGLNQINVRVPSGLAPGLAIPLRLNYLSRPSNEVTLAIQ